MVGNVLPLKTSFSIVHARKQYSSMTVTDLGIISSAKETP